MPLVGHGICCLPQMSGDREQPYSLAALSRDAAQSYQRKLRGNVMVEVNWMGSALADKSAAKVAVELAMPMIESGIASRYMGKSGFLYIVIMDPALRPENSSFEQAILYEHAVGDREAWDADYALYARGKARACWRAQRNGHELRYFAPHLLRATDAGVWGGIWHDGIAVGVSGADPWFDEAIGTSIASLLRAIAKQRALEIHENLELGRYDERRALSPPIN